MLRLWWMSRPDLNPRGREGAAERDDPEGHRERVGLGLPLLQRGLPLLVLLLLLRRLNGRGGSRRGRQRRRESSGAGGEEKQERAHGQLEHQRRRGVRHPLPAGRLLLDARRTPRGHRGEPLRSAAADAEPEAGGEQVVGRVVGEARVVGLGEEEMERPHLHPRCPEPSQSRKRPPGAGQGRGLLAFADWTPLSGGSRVSAYQSQLLAEILRFR